MTEPTIVPFPPASHPASPNSLAAVQALCTSGQTIQARRMVNLVACMLSGRQLPRVMVRMVGDAGRSVAARLKFDLAGVCVRVFHQQTEMARRVLTWPSRLMRSAAR